MGLRLENADWRHMGPEKAFFSREPDALAAQTPPETGLFQRHDRPKNGLPQRLTDQKPA